MRLNCFMLAVCFTTSAAMCAESNAPRIELEEFRIERATLPLGEPIVIHARVATRGVRLGSFLLRTAEEVPKKQTIAGFPLYSSGKYYVAQDGKYYILDNGRLDRNPKTNELTLDVPTQDWKPGVYVFAFFASVRPAGGPFVGARRDFEVVVKDDRVVVEDLGDIAMAQSVAIRSLDVAPRQIEAGQTVTLSLDTGPAVYRGIEIINPYPIPPEETLAGFDYDTKRKVSFLGLADNGPSDRDPESGKIVVEIDTHDWPAGSHHLQVNTISLSGRTSDYRSFAVQVRGPRDRLNVAVGDSYYFSPGTHFEKFLQLRNGSLLCGESISTDGGRTWQPIEVGFGVGGAQLADGRVLGLTYRCLPQEETDGLYHVERFLSEDDGRSFAMTQARVIMPQAKAAMGHGPHVGPLFMRSIVQRNDGSLVALMAGWFHGDDALCPYGHGRPYSRTYACESDDDGRSWRFLSNIGYDQIGSEGYNEGSMRRLPSGELLAVLRTGSEKDMRCHDNPIMWAVSPDEGRTWSTPERTGVEGAFPSLAVLSDGLLVLSYGRPGAMLVFSADGGRTWTDQTVVDTTPYSGYTDVVEIGPGRLLVGFGVRAFLDEKTSVRVDQLRLAPVRYELAPQ